MICAYPSRPHPGLALADQYAEVTVLPVGTVSREPSLVARLYAGGGEQLPESAAETFLIFFSIARLPLRPRR